MQELEKLMTTSDRGFCPFRIAKPNFQAGCVLEPGERSFCYTRDQRPLIRRETQIKGEYYYTCHSKKKLKISKEIYQEIEKVVSSILLVQDESELTINLWPIFCRESKITTPKRESVTSKGKEIQSLSQSVRDKLQKIILDLT